MTTARPARVPGRRLLAALAVAAGLGDPAWAQPRDPSVILEVKRFEVAGELPLTPAEVDETLRPHLGLHKDLATIEAAATALENRVRELGFAFHRIIVPAQKPVDGVVRLQVLRFPLGSVEVKGNEHFSAENVLAALPGLVPGTSPDVRELGREIALANEHPAKRLALVMKEGQATDTVDAEVRVRDASPAQTIVSLTGQTRDQYDEINRNTGYTRLSVAHQRSDLFDLDHALTAVFTTSPDEVRKVSQLGLFYWIPLYGYNTSLQFHYTRSDVNTGVIGAGLSGADFNVSGRGEFLGVRATYDLPKWGGTAQTLSAALDDKHYTSSVGLNIGAVSTALSPPDIHARPVSLRYALRDQQSWGSIGGFLEYAVNTHGGSDNTAAAYAATRARAGFHWEVRRYGLDASTQWSDWTLSARYRGQYSHSTLIPGEMFGIGGPGTVRGLRDRELTGDKGHALTLEAQGPALVDTLRPVIFYDQGRVVLNTANGIQPSSEAASSIGAGLRWTWRNHLEAAADLAHVIDGTRPVGTVPGTRAGRSKITFNLLYRF